MMNDDLSLLAALTQCFEKDEVVRGYHLRTVPFGSEAVARERFMSWRAELERWLGPPEGEDGEEHWQRVWWQPLRMKRTQRGIALWVRSAEVDLWWHERHLWLEPGLESFCEWEPRPFGS